MLKRWFPFRKGKRLSFISIHYIYMISMALIGSLLLLPSSGMPYIDALFFASGSATQSGLNTIDINKIRTYQQVILYMIAMLCNPIVVHSFVVFVRLYWFERRFQHVVKEAQSMRQIKSRSRTNTKGKDDVDEGNKGKDRPGVNGRDIVVVRNNGLDGAAEKTDDDKRDVEAVAESVDSYKSERNSGESSEDKTDQRRPTKLYTDLEMVRSPDSAPLRIPEQFSTERHIAFLESQRNNQETLRIPSPREWDSGGLPEAVAEEDEDGGRLARIVTSPIEQCGAAFNDPVKKVQSEDQQNFRSHITIDEPIVSHTRTRTTTFPRAGPRKATTEPPEPPPNAFLRAKTRAGTFSSMLRPTASFMRSQSHEEEDPMPYLSWQPTIGRNSAFYDLTEEQREELGGVEYRALKTLALVLVCYFVAFHLLGVICFLPWILRTETWGKIVDDAGQGRTWWAIFTAASAFNDLGFTLTPDSMISFGSAVLPMLLMTFLIVIGNTGFPCMLRFVIWIVSKMVPRGSGIWEELRFLLDHPRRCYTLLFPGPATWWLFWILIFLNGVDLVFFIILDVS
jgi:potassium uptake Trk family protein